MLTDNEYMHPEMKNLHRTDPGGYPFQWRQQMPMFGAKSDHGECTGTVSYRTALWHHCPTWHCIRSQWPLAAVRPAELLVRRPGPDTAPYIM